MKPHDAARLSRKEVLASLETDGTGKLMPADTWVAKTEFFKQCLAEDYPGYSLSELVAICDDWIKLSKMFEWATHYEFMEIIRAELTDSARVAANPNVLAPPRRPCRLARLLRWVRDRFVPVAGVVLLMTSCGGPSYRYAIELRIPDDRRLEAAAWITETVRGCTYHLTAGDYEDPEDLLAEAEAVAVRLYGLDVEGLWVVDLGTGAFIPMDKFSPGQRAIFDELKSGK